MLGDYKDYLFRIYEKIFVGFDTEELSILYDFLLIINKNLCNLSNENKLKI